MSTAPEPGLEGWSVLAHETALVYRRTPPLEADGTLSDRTSWSDAHRQAHQWVMQMGCSGYARLLAETVNEIQRQTIGQPNGSLTTVQPIDYFVDRFTIATHRPQVHGLGDDEHPFVAILPAIPTPVGFRTKLKRHGLEADVELMLPTRGGRNASPDAVAEHGITARYQVAGPRYLKARRFEVRSVTDAYPTVIAKSVMGRLTGGRTMLAREDGGPQPRVDINGMQYRGICWQLGCPLADVTFHNVSVATIADESLIPLPSSVEWACQFSVDSGRPSLAMVLHFRLAEPGSGTPLRAVLQQDAYVPVSRSLFAAPAQHAAFQLPQPQYWARGHRPPHIPREPEHVPNTEQDQLKRLDSKWSRER